MSFPITDPKSPQAQEAAELYERADAAAQLMERLKDEHAAAHADVRRLSAELEDELHAAALTGQTGSRKAATLGTKLAEARAKAAEPYAERIRAASTAADVRRQEYAAFVDAHFEALHAEFIEAAHASRERIVAAIEELAGACAADRDLAERVERLTGHATHLEPRDVGVPAISATGTRRSYHAADPRIVDPTAAMRAKLAHNLDAALPLPLVSEQALAWRRDRLAGLPTEASNATKLRRAS
jgi:hypothetical protein